MAEEPRWRRYLRFWGRDPVADVEDELSFHLSERAALNEQRGLAPDAARIEAERRFGDVTRIRSECLMETERATRRLAWHERIADVGRDVRVALRSLAAAPVFTITAGAALALGIGANTAVFTVVSAVLLRPLPYGEPERVVSVHNSWDETPEGSLSPAEYLDLRDRVRAFESLGVSAGTFVNLQEGDVPERLPASIVSPSALHALRVMPAAGRFFTEAEGRPGGGAVAILSWDFWQSRLNGADVVGRSLRVDGRSTMVVGVLPDGVRLPDEFDDAAPAAVFLPARIDHSNVVARGSHFLDGVARLAPGWTVESANAELARVAAEMVAAYPDDYPADMRFTTWARPVHELVVADSKRLLTLLSSAVAMVLLIACANVASLVLTRTEERRRELAVRSALGAGRGRIARQLIVEHLVLGLGAAAAGVVLAYFAVQALMILRPAELPRLEEAGIDLRVLAFTLALTLLATLLVALAPLRAAGSSQATLRDAGTRTTATRASRRLRHALITAEVALCIVLLAGAGLLLRSFANLLTVDAGYRTERVLTVPVTLPASSYPDDDARRRFFAQLDERVSQLPGVLGAGAVFNLPLASSVGDINIQIEGRVQAETDVSPRLDWQLVTPGWFDAMGIALVRGRGILPSDDATRPGAVVLSESAARKYWGDVDPIGQRFKLGGEAGPGWVTVVGVVRDVRHAALSEPPPAVMYLPHAQFTFWNGGSAATAMTLVVHTARDPLSVLPLLREEMKRLDPAVPLGTVRTMQQVVSGAVAAPRFASSVLGSFALLALALALIGVYGLVAYTVARRTREIAVRMALGAEPGTLVMQMLMQGMRPVLAGVLLGAAAALVATRVLQHMLFGVTPHDPAAVASTIALLILTALVACTLPARRATRIAPQSALREE